MKCDIEIFKSGVWQIAASFELKDDAEIGNGIKGAGFFEYDLDYAIANMNTRAIEAVSCLFPVNFDLRSMTRWPSFLSDILPSGANRRYFLKELGISDNAEADWPLLLAGGGNPPGNLRIRQAVQAPPVRTVHEGFDYEEIINREEHFIEYAKENDAPVAGSSGAQGDAPKFLLTQDRNGKFHADGALADHLARKHWIVKFPISGNKSDRDILRNEGAYFFVAKSVGLHVGENVAFDSDALFIPRFDRLPTDRGVVRFGLESLASLSKIGDFGVPVPMETLCESIARFSSNPVDDLKEFVFRDILNVALGNTDNHARNSAMLKYPDGSVRLSPLYDFAPMFLDVRGIPRVCRWTGAESMGFPEWGAVSEILKNFHVDPNQMREHFALFAKKVKRLPDIMAACKVDKCLIDRLAMRIDDVRRALEETKP